MISEYTPLFGFMESGYRLAVVLTLIFDSLTSVLLALFVVALARSRRQRAAPMSTRPARRRVEGDTLGSVPLSRSRIVSEFGQPRGNPNIGGTVRTPARDLRIDVDCDGLERRAVSIDLTAF